jgi:hypothetical protein
LSHVVLSSEVGADKPSPLIFQALLRQANVAPHEVLHVGNDRERDLEGAQVLACTCVPSPAVLTRLLGSRIGCDACRARTADGKRCAGALEGSRVIEQQQLNFNTETVHNNLF